MITSLRLLLLTILDLYWWVIIAAVISSWLVGFGIINAYNPIARSILRALHALTEPVVGQVRRVIPALAGRDLARLMVLLLLTFGRNWLAIGTFF